MRTRTRAAIALSVAAVVLIAAGVAAATKADPRPPVMPVAESSDASGGAGGSMPGNPGGGATVTPVAPHASVDCGEHMGPGSGPDTSVSYTPCPGDDPIDLAGHAQTVVPTPGMDNVTPVPWTKGSVGSDDRTVTLRFWSGVEPCYVLDHVDVAYRPDGVIVTLFQGNDPGGGQVACIDIAMLKQTTITLDQPLAGRPVVDGARL